MNTLVILSGRKYWQRYLYRHQCWFVLLVIASVVFGMTVQFAPMFVGDGNMEDNGKGCSWLYDRVWVYEIKSFTIVLSSSHLIVFLSSSTSLVLSSTHWTSSSTAARLTSSSAAAIERHRLQQLIARCHRYQLVNHLPQQQLVFSAAVPSPTWFTSLVCSPWYPLHADDHLPHRIQTEYPLNFLFYGIIQFISISIVRISIF